MRGEARPTAGFTLAEVLVALVVTSLILAALGHGLHFFGGVWRREARDNNRGADIVLLDETLRRVVGAIEPGLSVADPPLFEGNSHGVRFISGARLWQLGVAGDRRLVLEWSTPFANLTGDSSIGASTLLEGVERFDIAYWRPGAGWQGAWAEQKLPTLIRFHVTFPRDSGRRVPDVIAAPMREAWRS
jgi:prepilin-type N-terminal cleavage/methylation domain-containing protein